MASDIAFTKVSNMVSGTAIRALCMAPGTGFGKISNMTPGTADRALSMASNAASSTDTVTSDKIPGISFDRDLCIAFDRVPSNYLKILYDLTLDIEKMKNFLSKKKVPVTLFFPAAVVIDPAPQVPDYLRPVFDCILVMCNLAVQHQKLLECFDSIPPTIVISTFIQWPLHLIHLDFIINDLTAQIQELEDLCTFYKISVPTKPASNLRIIDIVPKELCYLVKIYLSICNQTTRLDMLTKIYDRYSSEGTVLSC